MRSSHIGLALLLIVFAATNTAGREYETFDIVGDSISFGVNPECLLQYGWAQMLFGSSGCGQSAMTQTIYTLWPDIEAYNTAWPGSKASDWADPNYTFTKTVLAHDPDLVVVWIGGNDGLDYAADGVYTEKELGEYRTNLTTIIQILRSNAPPPEIIVCNYYDLFDGYSANLPAGYEAYRALSPATVTGNEMIRSVAESNGCFYVDIYTPLFHHAYGEEIGDTGHLSPDYFDTPLANLDIHPNTAGHQAVYQALYQTLQHLKNMPTLQSPHRPAEDVFTFEWSQGFGQTAVVERADTAGAPFVPIATNTGPPVTGFHTDSIDSVDRAFYRIKLSE